jgi:hypothetical protein
MLGFFHDVHAQILFPIIDHILEPNYVEEDFKHWSNIEQQMTSNLCISHVGKAGIARA